MSHGMQDVEEHAAKGKSVDDPEYHAGLPTKVYHAETPSYWVGLRIFNERVWKFEDAHPHLGLWQPAVCILLCATINECGTNILYRL